MREIKLDKGIAIIKSNKCVNSNWIARFLANENQECCQCSFGECKIDVQISYNGHNFRNYVLTEKEIKVLPILLEVGEEVEEIPVMKGTREALDKIVI